MGNPTYTTAAAAAAAVAWWALPWPGRLCLAWYVAAVASDAAFDWETWLLAELWWLAVKAGRAAAGVCGGGRV